MIGSWTVGCLVVKHRGHSVIQVRNVQNQVCTKSPVGELPRVGDRLPPEACHEESSDF